MNTSKEKVKLMSNKSFNKEKDNSQKTQSKNTGDNKRIGALSLIIWLIFVIFALLAGFVLYSRIKDFDIQTQQIQNMMTQSFNLEIYDSIQAVFGITDENDEFEEDEIAEDSEVEGNLTNEIENERHLQLRESLLLQLPEESDNPNYPVTFTEPTEEGVEIKIDGGEYTSQESPYLLPSLSLGSHTISFRFNDESGVTKILEDEIVIIPRTPVISASQKNDFNESEDIVIEGSALPNSKLVYVVGSTISTGVIDVDNSGNWAIDLSENISSGDHNVVLMVRKNGFSSNFSDPFNFSIGQVVGVESDAVIIDGMEDSLNSSFTINSIWDANNYLYVYTVFGGGIFLVLFALYFSANRGKQNLQILSRIKDRKSNDAESDESDVDLKGSSNSNKVSIRDKLEALKDEESNGSEVSEELNTSEAENIEAEGESADDDDVKEDTLVTKNKDSDKKEKKKKTKRKTKTKKLKSKGIKSDRVKPQSQVKSNEDLKVYSKEEFLEEFEGEFDDDENNDKDNERKSKSSKSKKNMVKKSDSKIVDKVEKSSKRKTSKAKRIEITLTSK